MAEGHLPRQHPGRLFGGRRLQGRHRHRHGPRRCSRAMVPLGRAPCGWPTPLTGLPNVSTPVSTEVDSIVIRENRRARWVRGLFNGSQAKVTTHMHQCLRDQDGKPLRGRRRVRLLPGFFEDSLPGPVDVPSRCCASMATCTRRSPPRWNGCGRCWPTVGLWSLTTGNSSSPSAPSSTFAIAGTLTRRFSLPMARSTRWRTGARGTCTCRCARGLCDAECCAGMSAKCSGFTSRARVKKSERSRRR